MRCENCGGKNLDQQGSAIVGPDRNEAWASEFLDHKIYTCLTCKGTFIYKEEKNE